MNIVTQNYDLDMIPGDVPLIVPVKQYDNTSRQIQFTLYSGSNAFILQSTASVRCDGTKPDGNGFSETCSYSGNVVTLVVTQQMAAVSGNVPCQLTVTDSGGVIGTATFILFVWPAALNNSTVISNSDISAIVTASQQAAASAAQAAESAANALPAKESSEYPGCYYITGDDGVQRWINPPLIYGTEYLLYQQYNGENLYCMLINFGSMPNTSTSTVTFTNYSITPVFSSGVAANSSETDPFPVIFSSGIVAFSYIQPGNSGVLVVKTSADLSSYSAKFFVLYTK